MLGFRATHHFIAAVRMRAAVGSPFLCLEPKQPRPPVVVNLVLIRV